MLLQLVTIHFDLHVVNICIAVVLLWIDINLHIQHSNILINSIGHKRNRVYKISSWCELYIPMGS